MLCLFFHFDYYYYHYFCHYFIFGDLHVYIYIYIYIHIHTQKHMICVYKYLYIYLYSMYILISRHVFLALNRPGVCGAHEPLDRRFQDGTPLREVQRRACVVSAGELLKPNM